MLRKLLMLMALLSGLTALYAPERALAREELSSQVEAGMAEDGVAEQADYAAVFGPSWIARADDRAVPSSATAIPATAPTVAIRVDRARE